MSEEQDPKRWFADGFGGRWNVGGDLAAKIHRKSATLNEARSLVEMYIDDALKGLGATLDLQTLESFSDEQITAESRRRGIDYTDPELDEAPDA